MQSQREKFGEGSERVLNSHSNAKNKKTILFPMVSMGNGLLRGSNKNNKNKSKKYFREVLDVFFPKVGHHCPPAGLFVRFSLGGWVACTA